MRNHNEFCLVIFSVIVNNLRGFLSLEHHYWCVWGLLRQLSYTLPFKRKGLSMSVFSWYLFLRHWTLSNDDCNCNGFSTADSKNHHVFPKRVFACCVTTFGSSGSPLLFQIFSASFTQEETAFGGGLCLVFLLYSFSADILKTPHVSLCVWCGEPGLNLRLVQGSRPMHVDLSDIIRNG